MICSLFILAALSSLRSVPHVQQEVISTGSLGLDVALGIGGLPKARVSFFYGIS
nr:hypothetical protein [Ferruginibacter sp.]